MFSLGIYDKLTPGALTGNRQVAGTGTIDDAGKVGPIGGIKQKLAGARAGGAEFFLAPAEQLPRGRRRHPRRARGLQGRHLRRGSRRGRGDRQGTHGRAAPLLIRPTSRTSRGLSPRRSPAGRRRAPVRGRGRWPPRRRSRAPAGAAGRSRCRLAARRRAGARPDGRGGRRGGRRQPRGAPGRSRSASGGTTIRSIAKAHPSTSGGQARRPSSVSSELVAGRPSCSTALSAPSARSAVPICPRRWGSRASRSAVRTRAKSRGGWSQPAAATWRSASRAAMARGSATGCTFTAPMLPYAAGPGPTAYRCGWGRGHPGAVGPVLRPCCARAHAGSRGALGHGAASARSDSWGAGLWLRQAAPAVLSARRPQGTPRERQQLRPPSEQLQRR